MTDNQAEETKTIDTYPNMTHVDAYVNNARVVKKGDQYRVAIDAKIRRDVDMFNPNAGDHFVNQKNPDGSDNHEQLITPEDYNHILALNGGKPMTPEQYAQVAATGKPINTKNDNLTFDVPKQVMDDPNEFGEPNFKVEAAKMKRGSKGFNYQDREAMLDKSAKPMQDSMTELKKHAPKLAKEMKTDARYGFAQYDRKGFSQLISTPTKHELSTGQRFALHAYNGANHIGNAIDKTSLVFKSYKRHIGDAFTKMKDTVKDKTTALKDGFKDKVDTIHDKMDAAKQARLAKQQERAQKRADRLADRMNQTNMGIPTDNTIPDTYDACKAWADEKVNPQLDTQKARTDLNQYRENQAIQAFDKPSTQSAEPAKKAQPAAQPAQPAQTSPVNKQPMAQKAIPKSRPGMDMYVNKTLLVKDKDDKIHVAIDPRQPQRDGKAGHVADNPNRPSSARHMQFIGMDSLNKIRQFNGKPELTQANLDKLFENKENHRGVVDLTDKNDTMRTTTWHDNQRATRVNESNVAPAEKSFDYKTDEAPLLKNNKDLTFQRMAESERQTADNTRRVAQHQQKLATHQRISSGPEA